MNGQATTAQPFGLLTRSSLLLAVLLYASPCMANLVPNYSVEEVNPEDDSLPFGWVHSDWGDYEATFDYTVDGFYGFRALKVAGSQFGLEGDAKWKSSMIEVEAGGGAYVVSDYYRADVETELTVLAQADGGLEQWLTAKKVPPSADWALADGEVTLPPWATHVQVMHIISGTGWLVTDAYSLVKGTLPDDPENPDDPDPVTPSETSGAKVSVVTDDGFNSFHTRGFPIMEKYDIRGTHFIHSDWVDKDGWNHGEDSHMASDKLKDLANAGHEIGSHAREHPEDVAVFADYSSSELEDQLSGSKDRLEGFGFDVVGFAPPGGSFDDQVTQAVKDHYKYMRTIEEGMNLPGYDPYRLKCYTVYDTTTVEQLDGWVKDAAAKKGWVVLLYHRFSDDPEDLAAPGGTFVAPDKFDEQMSYLADSGATVEPMGEILGEWSPSKVSDNEGNGSGGGSGGSSLSGVGPIGETDSSISADPGGCAATPGSSSCFSAWMLLIVGLFAALLRRRVRPGPC